MSKKSRQRARQRDADKHRADTARSVEGVPAYARGSENEAALDERERPLRGPSDDEAEPEPNRENRPAVEELVGISEYQVRSASNLDQGDPITALIEAEASGGEDLYQPEIATGQPKGGPPLEPISVEPDELGANYLRGAAQDPRPIDDARSGESEPLTRGEKHMLDAQLGGAATEGALVTSLPDRSDEEAKLSELTERAGREVRPRVRAKRIREQSLRVAKQRRTTRRAT